MAIFVIEDDAQNGPDHVDAHRTAGLVISPYCKRGFVDSTFYTTASMVRTMELILGLPPLTQYDAGATPMFNCFQTAALAKPFSPLAARVDLTAKNTLAVALRQAIRADGFPRVRPRARRRAESHPVGCRQRAGRPLPHAHSPRDLHPSG